MIIQSQIINLQGLYRIHTEYLQHEQDKPTLLVAKDPLSTNSWLLHNLRYLYPNFNVVLFDEPHTGLSRPHNQGLNYVSEHQQIDILLALGEHFACHYLLSTAGAAHISLQALKIAPNAFAKAVIEAYSPRLTVSMRHYLRFQLQNLEHSNLVQFAAAYNSTLGQFLSKAFQQQTQLHIAQLSQAERQQLILLYQRLLAQPEQDYPTLKAPLNSEVLFINGEWDRYCHPIDVQRMRLYAPRCQFRQLKQTGHCLSYESSGAWLQNRDAQLAFFLPPQSACA